MRGNHFLAVDPRERDAAHPDAVRVYDQPNPPYYMNRTELEPIWDSKALVIRRRQSKSSEEPSIVFDEVLFDFGPVSCAKTISHTFHFKNEGRSPLEITRIAKTCRCVSATSSVKSLDPGKTGAFVAEIDWSDKRGKEEQKIRVYTNDPDHPQTVLTIRGQVLGTNRVVPSHVDFGRVAVGQRVTRQIRLDGDGVSTPQIREFVVRPVRQFPEDGRIVAASFQAQVVSAPQQLDESTTAARSENDHGTPILLLPLTPLQSNCCFIDLVASPSLQAAKGMLYGEVTLRLEGEDAASFVIPVKMEVCHSYCASPPQIFLGRMPLNGAKAVDLVVQSARNPSTGQWIVGEFDIRSVQTVQYGREETARVRANRGSSTGGNGGYVHVEISAEKEGFVQSAILLEIERKGGETQTLEVPVVGMIVRNP